MKFLLFGAICGLFFVDSVFSVTRLVLSGTDFVDSGHDLNDPRVVNYLHGTKWMCSNCWTKTVYEFTECPHHVSEIVENHHALIEVAARHNQNRIPASIFNERAFLLWQNKSFSEELYQKEPCKVPRCIYSLDDLLVCGGIGLAVREWATIQGVDARMQNGGPRGVNCATHRIVAWMDDTQSKIHPGNNALQDMLNMVNFARQPVICKWALKKD